MTATIVRFRSNPPTRTPPAGPARWSTSNRAARSKSAVWAEPAADTQGLPPPQAVGRRDADASSAWLRSPRASGFHNTTFPTPGRRPPSPPDGLMQQHPLVAPSVARTSSCPRTTERSRQRSPPNPTNQTWSSPEPARVRGWETDCVRETRQQRNDEDVRQRRCARGPREPCPFRPVCVDGPPPRAQANMIRDPGEQCARGEVNADNQSEDAESYQIRAALASAAQLG